MPQSKLDVVAMNDEMTSLHPWLEGILESRRSFVLERAEEKTKDLLKFFFAAWFNSEYNSKPIAICLSIWFSMTKTYTRPALDGLFGGHFLWKHSTRIENISRRNTL